MRTFPNVHQSCFGQHPNRMIVYSEPRDAPCVSNTLLPSAADTPRPGLYPVLFTSYDFTFPQDVRADALVDYLKREMAGAEIGHTCQRLVFGKKLDLVEAFEQLLTADPHDGRTKSHHTQEGDVFLPVRGNEILKTAHFGLRMVQESSPPQPRRPSDTED